MNGKLITFEGVDGSGKTTQINLLERFLKENGFTVHKVCHPTHLFNSVKKTISGINKFPKIELLAYMVDMAFSVQTKIIPLLQNGCIVLCDRYIDSTIVYQGYAGKIPPSTVRSLIDFSVHYHYPDLTIWLDLWPELAIQRVKERDGVLTDNDDLDFYEKVCIGYRNMWYTHPEGVIRVDASHLDMTKVNPTIQAAVLELLDK